MSEKFNFETEISQILELLTNSIYSNKEIFIRELVSNASDAIDKARIKSLTDTSYLGNDTEFQITIDVDSDAKTITINDNGIGMNKADLKKNIGMIAHSGTKKFLEALKKDNTAKDSNLIGQFGIGFYSVFMVADKVELTTKTANSKTAYTWTSNGKGAYEIDKSDKTTRGTSIKIYLKKGEEQFANEQTIKGLIKQHSNYIPIPIKMLATLSEDDKKANKTAEYETVNETKSIWKKMKKDVTAEEYKQFYSSLSYDFNEPLTHLHLNIEGTIEYKSLLFVPQKKNMMFNPQNQEDFGPKLYVQNVLILEHCKDLLPVWLRFVQGVVETNDLPLNVSREMLQNNQVVTKIRNGLTTKILSELKKLSTNEKDKYNEFFENFGHYLKEGIHYDFTNKEKIAEILRYDSLLENKKISLDDYLGKKTHDKKEIYYLSGRNKAEILNSPYLEIFKEKKIDVLLMSDPIDEYVVNSLPEFKEYKLKSISDTDLELEEKNEEVKKEEENKKTKFKDLLELIKKTVGETKLSEVKITTRLKGSLAALATKPGETTPQMEKIMKAMGQPVPTTSRVLELNPDNEILIKMLAEFKNNANSEKLKELITYIYEQAILNEGGELDNMGNFIKRVNKFAKKYI